MPVSRTALLRAEDAAQPEEEAAQPEAKAAQPEGEAAQPEGKAASAASYGEAELASYFASGPLKRAADALQAGRAAQALKLLPRRPEDVPARWLRALALRAADRPRAARAAFEELAAGGGPLGDRALHLAALCAIDGGEAAAADRLLAPVPARYVDADQ